VPPRMVRKSAPWQIWQEKKLPSPGAVFAELPCGWAAGGVATHPGIVPWWQPAVFPKQETLEIPPERSEPWQLEQELGDSPEMYSFVAAPAWSDPPVGTTHPATELPDGSRWFTG